MDVKSISEHELIGAKVFKSFDDGMSALYPGQSHK